jgi:hypothetical protein
MNCRVQIIVVGIKIVKGRRLLSGAKMTGSGVGLEAQLCKHYIVALFAGPEE